jgi:hypothetical protein
MVGKAERPADHRQFPLDIAPGWEWGGRIVGQMAPFATLALSAGSLNIAKVTVCGPDRRGIRHA